MGLPFLWGQSTGPVVANVSIKRTCAFSFCKHAGKSIVHSWSSESLQLLVENQHMTPYKKRKCELTQRLAEDMMIRNLADATIDAYTYHVRRFADFIEKPLDQATVEDVRTFQLYLIQERKLAYSTFNQAVCALRFLYTPHHPQSPGRSRWFPSASVPRRCPPCSADKKSTGSSNARPISSIEPF